MKSFIINTNNYLSKRVLAYFHQFYTGFQQEGNPDFLNTLKNIFRTESRLVLSNAQNAVEKILIEDLPAIIKTHNLSECVIVSVPRSKAEKTLYAEQSLFRKAISNVAQSLPQVIDGTQCIVRHTNTKTTHIKKTTTTWQGADGSTLVNDGVTPYPGITKETCTINKQLIENKDVILIDDIYTHYVNIDEDCIQTLLDNGARRVIFYSIAYTNTKRYTVDCY